MMPLEDVFMTHESQSQPHQEEQEFILRAEFSLWTSPLAGTLLGVLGAHDSVATPESLHEWCHQRVEATKD